LEEKADELVHRVTVVGDMDRYTAETLWLEVRRLAKHFQLEVRESRIESARRQSRDEDG
jgi:Holliday junction resolvasome RuvABC ATP-dependent DNA helicase subunit